FDDFWRLVADCLAPDGRLFFIENAHPSRGRNLAPELFQWQGDSVADTSVEGIDSVTDLKTGISTRLAANGETYDLVTIWWEPDQLQARLESLGWRVAVEVTEWAFLYGHGSLVKES